MAAVAFVETAIFKGASNGETKQYSLTVSDVAAAFAIGQDGSDFIQLPSDQPYALIDMIVVVGGTDTNFQEIFANGQSTGIKLSNKSNLNTSNYRQFQQAPMVFKPGTVLKLKQLA